MSGYKFDQHNKYIIAPNGDEIEWCYATQWLNDLQSSLDSEESNAVKLGKKLDLLQKENARLRATLNRLYKSVSDGEHLSKEWIKDALLAKPNGIAIEALVKMRSVDAVKIKELESTILDLQSELARKKMSLTVACNRVEELEGKLKIAVGCLNGQLEHLDEWWSVDVIDTLEQLGELK